MKLATRIPDTPTAQAATIAGVRAAVVAVLGGVPGLVPTPTPPDVPVTGSAWPRWITSTPAGGHLEWPRRHTFDIYVCLDAGDLATTITQADALLEVVLPALAPVVTVATIGPVLVQFGADVLVPALVIRATSRA